MVSVCMGVLTAMAVMAAPQSTRKLLNCNTPIGADQQVEVEQRGPELILRELTTATGEWQERPLSQAEWSSRRIQLRTDSDGTRTTLSLSRQGNWLDSFNDSGYRETAEADCN